MLSTPFPSNLPPPPMPHEAERPARSATFHAAERRSRTFWKAIAEDPRKFRVLTGDRPTGSLHIGHLFGSLENRVHLQSLGVTTFIVLADYQVLTDRGSTGQISENVREIVFDYLAAGLDPENGRTFIFPHSQVPALHQLLLPLLSLVSLPELDRNPTIKEETRAAGLRKVNALMYAYPIHQGADILFCKGNVVPVGKDQLPHLELARKLARRFNTRFPAVPPVFPEPAALLSDEPAILGLDGRQKMSKSRGNAISLKATPEETAGLITAARTDSQRRITFDPESRPEVANLLRLASLCTGRLPELIAEDIGDGGSGRLKKLLTETLNARLASLRARRKELARDPGYVADVLRRGSERARSIAESTLVEVRKAMGMVYGD